MALDRSLASRSIDVDPGLGLMTSGFTFIGIDAYVQGIVKGIIIVAAVVADQYRQRRRSKA